MTRLWLAISGMSGLWLLLMGGSLVSVRPQNPPQVLRFQAETGDGFRFLYTVRQDGNRLTKLFANAGIYAHSDWSPTGEYIVFQTRQAGDDELYSVRPDGTHLYNLSNNPAADDNNPIWSPNGRWIAFVSNRDGNTEVYRARPDGTQLVNLSHHPAQDFSPTWSPDSNYIAFQSKRDGNWEIHITRADGADTRNLTRHAAVDSAPFWSQHGIVFLSDRDNNIEIYRMNPDGTGLTNLTQYEKDDVAPYYASNGDWVAYRHGSDDQRYRLHLGRGLSAPFVNSSYTYDGQPNWSPDGAWIVFDSLREGDEEIFLARSDGSQMLNLTNHPRHDVHPTWSPDGAWIAFDSNRTGRSQIFVMRADGSGQQQVIDTPSRDFFPEWSPAQVQPWHAEGVLGVGLGLLLLWGVGQRFFIIT